MPQRRLSIKRATALGPVAFRGHKQIAAKNTLVINQLKLICGTPKKEKTEEERKREGELKRSRQKLTERSANYEWIFSQLEGFTPFPLLSPPYFLPHNFYNESQRSTGNYLASETVWFMQRCATVFCHLDSFERFI